jgi:hypothetical protein
MDVAPEWNSRCDEDRFLKWVLETQPAELKQEVGELSPLTNRASAMLPAYLLATAFICSPATHSARTITAMHSCPRDVTWCLELGAMLSFPEPLYAALRKHDYRDLLDSNPLYERWFCQRDPELYRLFGEDDHFMESDQFLDAYPPMEVEGHFASFHFLLSAIEVNSYVECVLAADDVKQFFSKAIGRTSPEVWPHPTSESHFLHPLDRLAELVLRKEPPYLQPSTLVTRMMTESLNIWTVLWRMRRKLELEGLGCDETSGTGHNPKVATQWHPAWVGWILRPSEVALRRLCEIALHDPTFSDGQNSETESGCFSSDQIQYLKSLVFSSPLVRLGRSLDRHHFDEGFESLLRNGNLTLFIPHLSVM